MIEPRKEFDTQILKEDLKVKFIKNLLGILIGMA